MRPADPRRRWLVGALAWIAPGILAASLAFGAETGTTPQTGLDRAALDAELSRPLVEVQRQGPEALRSYAQRLMDFHAALDLSHDVPPDERQLLGDRILGRAAQVGLLVRDAIGHPSRNLPERGGGQTAALPAALGGVLDFFGESSILLVGLLGGVIVAYAL
ncbi:MAG: hypothetical protein EHM71_11215 [Zetaproteobacteria bacterium]|nr:MAG: hypothetical protein EHM71_11215 [Zetaproteobacteria bacterium]